MDIANELAATWPEVPEGLASVLRNKWAEVAQEIAQLPASSPPNSSHPMNRLTMPLAGFIAESGRADDPLIKDFLENAAAAAGVEESWKATFMVTTIVQATAASSAD